MYKIRLLRKARFVLSLTIVLCLMGAASALGRRSAPAVSPELSPTQAAR